MTTITIEITDSAPLEFTVPSSWDECTDKQLTQIWNLQTRTEPGDFELLVLILQLSGIPADILDQAVESYGEDADSMLFDLLEVLNFLKTPIKLKKSRMAKLFGWRGPKDRLKGMPLEQLGLTETCLRAYLKSKDTLLLNTLIGLLYRPVFMPFNNRWYWVEIYAWFAKFLPLYIKLRMVLNFKGLFEQFTEDFEYVYKGKIKKSKSKHGWQATYLHLTETKFGNYRQTLKTEARLVMTYLDELGKDAIETQERLKSLKTKNGSSD